MTQNLNNIFGSSESYLDEVIILPWEVRNANTGTITLPAGYQWTDFEYIEWEMGVTTQSVSYDSVTITKEQIAVSPTDWLSYGNYNDIQYFSCNIRADNTTTATWTSTGGTNNFPILMKGYTRRYASRNMSKIVNVNNGDDVEVRNVYLIDIAKELGTDYLNRDLVVTAELYYEGTEYQGWAENPLDEWYSTSYNHNGVSAVVRDDGMIAVMTAGYNSSVNTNSYLIHNRQTEVWGEDSVNVTTAPCRIKVWKVDQYITNLDVGSDITMPRFQIFTQDTQLGSGEAALMDVSAGALVVTLPTNPVEGMYTAVGDYNGNCSILNPIVIRSANPIHGQDEDLVLTTPNVTVWVSYVNGVEGWRVVDGIGEDAGSVTPYEEVIILPYVSTGYLDNATFTLPEGYQWTDFEKIEVYGTLVTAPDQARMHGEISKEQITAYPTSFEVFGWDGANYAGMSATSINAGAISQGSNSYPVTYIKGYTKYRPVLNRGVTTLYEGADISVGNDVPLTESMGNFDTIRVYGKIRAGSSDFGGTVSIEVTHFNDTDFINITELSSTSNPASAYAAVNIDCNNSTDTSIRVAGGGTTYSALGIYKVTGINY